MKRFMFFSLLYLSSVFSFPIHAYVGINNRALVIVSELDSTVAPEMKQIYTTIEYLTHISAQSILGMNYGETELLLNNDATFPKFKSLIRNLAGRSDIHAIDVILSLHGSTTQLSFDDKRWKIADMEKNFLMANTASERALMVKVKRKLRMMYNLSCFGKYHNASFIKMGFDSSVGSVSVNANSEVEFLPVLTSWKQGSTFGASFNASNNPMALFLADEPIRILGRIQNNSLKITNSKKIFAGRSSIRISTDPQ